jgi:signal transduction histidine kinase/ligand-binding sensor domain-containing protein/CheY-like chemotaxis protein
MVMKTGILGTILHLVALGGLAIAPAWGQDAPGKEREPQGLEQDFLLRVWETADGLLPTNVRSITQTHDGYVWLAAYDGFVRFDGMRAVLFSGKNVPGLPAVPKGNKVFADSTGRLWAATADGRIFSFDQTAWREYRGAHGWPGFVVDSIAENAAGRLIFCGAKSLVQYASERFEPVALPELPPDFRPPLKAGFDAGGKLWLASPSHVWREEADGWKLVCSALSLKTPLHGVAPARDAGLWIATSRDVRKYVTDAPVSTLVRPEGFLGEDLELLEDFHGNVWGGSPSKGLRIWMPDGRIIKAGRNADSLSPQITSLFEDRERNVLVGTDGAGTARFKPRPFLAWFGQLGGLAGAMINSIGEDPPGRMLIGTEGSGLRQTGGGIPPALITTADGVLGRKQRITSLLHTRDGEMIAAVGGKGLFRLEGQNVVPIPTELLDGELVRALFEDSHGRLWVGHEHGIAVRDQGKFQRLPDEANSVLTNVRGIAEGRDGTMWFVGREGLARSTGGRLDLVSIPELPPAVNLLGLFVDQAGALWIGVESKGLLRWQDGHAFLFTARNGLPITSPGAFLEEGEYLWASGEKGLVRISRASLDAVAARRANRLELQLFNRDDGLPSDACRRGYQPAAFKASDGQLWFATHKGAISVHPQDITTATYEPPATIEEIRAELGQIMVTPANRDHIDIPAGTRHMTIRCAVPSLGKPDYARFQYLLEGFDNVWRDAGNERVIRFYDLTPGKYRFVVRAIGTDGRFVETPSSVTLFVHPFFWQRLWFRGLCLLTLLAAVGYVVWRSQQRHIRRQEEKLHEQEARAELEIQLQQSQKMDALGRLAGGIAHDFNNLLTSVGGNAELLQSELPPQSRQREIVNDIAAAAGRARELVSQILTFSRQRTGKNEALDPVTVLREAVQLLRAGLPAMIELQAEVPAKLPPILGDAAQVQRIVMNLGTNAAQAIGTKTGRIRIGAQDYEVAAEAPVDGVPAGRYVRLVVGDDGRGMDDQTLKRIFDPFFTTKAIGQGTGLGLSVVHGIVEAYGGHITVESQPAEGTVFQIYFPVTDQLPAPVAAPPPSPPVTPTTPLPDRAGVVMLVDDEAVVIKVTRTMLERLGYTVEAFADPLAAIAALAAAPDRYRLLLTDFSMPKIDGLELARRVWEVHPELPAILYTGYGGRLTESEAHRLGFAELLAKPFTMQKLGEAVAHALKGEGSVVAVPERVVG